MNTSVKLPSKLSSSQALTKRLPAGQGLSAVLLKRAAILTLDINHTLPRYVQDDQGRAWTLRLPEGSAPAHGDVLVGEDGTMVRVQGLSQPPVSEFKAGPTSASAASCCGHDHHGHGHHHAHDHAHAQRHDHGDHDHSTCGHDHHH